MVPQSITFTCREIHSLADRLFSRGASKPTLPPEQARDLRIAARLLWRFGAELSAGRVLCVDDSEAGE
jgi:hypothetical protein